MYLSQLRFNTSNKQARRDLSSPYELHATLCRAFAEEHESSPRFLWRLEEMRNRRSFTLLVQSQAEPQWTRLDQRFEGYFCDSKVKSFPVEHLQLGQVLRFRLKANPTVTRKDPNNLEKRKRYGLYKLEDLVGYEDEQTGEWQPGWLERQSFRSGFQLMGFMVAGSERVQMYKHGGGKPITLQSVLYEGHLKITEIDTFKGTLATGLGHAKALGFGLLSVAKG